MNHSYFLAGITLRNFFRLIKKHGVSLYPNYLIRILFLLQNGIWASFLKGYERRKLGDQLKNHPVPENPVFIVGHWRTGSTFLHKLMSLDKQCTAPTVFQISVPDSFLVSRKYYEPIMTKVMGKKRPMDNVKLGFDEPQEDEYALMKLTMDSPLIKLIFPNNDDYFLNGYEDFMPTDVEKWKREMSNFCKKLDFATGKRIILKNPFHSMRIPLLVKMFPDARFIHIYRNPYDVIPSTMNLWNIVGSQNQLKKKWSPPKLVDVVKSYNKILSKINVDFGILPDETKYELRFEDFEKNPVVELKKMYNHFKWEFTGDFEGRLKNHLANLKDYQKNKYSVTDSEKEEIHSILKNNFDGYS
jgi:hypothetical protein